MYVFGALLLGSLFCAGMLVARKTFVGWARYLFLMWNLALAWIPLMCAYAVDGLLKLRTPRAPLRLAKYAVALMCGAAWLMFFPNAPYLVTDLIHLRNDGNQTALWIDVAMFAAFAWVGCMLGIASLWLMHRNTERVFGRVMGWLFVMASAALGGFGVYLGRVERWNSWDIATRPFALLADIASRVLHPMAHSRTLAVSLMFGALMLCMYLTVRAMMDMRREP
jgi:uncharacterized membrane protein